MDTPTPREIETAMVAKGMLNFMDYASDREKDLLGPSKRRVHFADEDPRKLAVDSAPPDEPVKGG